MDIKQEKWGKFLSIFLSIYIKSIYTIFIISEYLCNNASSETHIRPRHASMETSMPYQRPPCLTKTHWRLICPIRDRHACGDPLETNMPVECNRQFNTYSVINTYFLYFLLIYINWNHVSTMIRHLGLWRVFD